MIKGEFGSGKTRYVNEKFKGVAEGVVAPDKGKEITRRSMPQLPHSIVHNEGSQVAFSFFDNLISAKTGTISYDSSLSNPKDIESYIDKIKKSKRFKLGASGNPAVLRIVDIARKDDARFLAVLRREVDGEDPRILPNRMKWASAYGKENRPNCINTVLNEKELTVEYVFHSGDEKGWNTEKVATFSKEKREFTQGLEKRMTDENIEWDEKTKTAKPIKKQEELQKEYNELFQKPVERIMDGLSEAENKINNECFSKRILLDNLSQESDIKSIEDLYDLLLPVIKNALPKESFVEAFKDVRQEVVKVFLTGVKEKGKLTYLQLPLEAAAIIHAKLGENPWKSVSLQ